MDYLQFIFQAVNNLLQSNLGFFDAMGQNMFRAFATIMVAWYGIKSALSAAGGKHFQFDNFASLLLTISFGFAMVNYYSTPIPGVGRSFHNLITDEAQYLGNQINQTELQTVTERIADFESRMDSPGFGDFLGDILYVVVMILLAAAQAVAIIVIAYGFVATAVCVLVGPVFIPFFIVPQDGVALLGLVQMLHPICLLSSHRRRRRFHHLESDSRHSRLAAAGQHLDRPASVRVPGFVHHLPLLHLCAPEDSHAHESHLQWHLGRLFGRRPRRSAVMSGDRSFEDAKRLYLEQYGDPMVTNTYLKIALVLLSLVAIGLALVDLRTIRTFQNFRPLVIRIDDLGRAEAINYHNFEYKPQDAEAKYFLSQFCTLYYSRNRYTIQDDFSKSLYFLDGKLADGILDTYRKDDIIKKFITNTVRAGDRY